MHSETHKTPCSVIVVSLDHDEIIRITSILKSAGFGVVHATYDSIYEVSLQVNPDLMIIDADYQISPDPIPILNVLYADEQTRNIPVILLTAAYGGFDVSIWRQALEGRHIPFFRKQYSPEHLIWYINNFFEALQATESTP